MKKKTDIAAFPHLLYDNKTSVIFHHTHFYQIPNNKTARLKPALRG